MWCWTGFGCSGSGSVARSWARLTDSPRSDQRGGPSPVLLGDVVQRTTLVIGPPTVPVLEILVHPIEGLGRGDVIVTCHEPSLSADAVRCPHGAEEHLDQIVNEAVVGENEPLAPAAQFDVPCPQQRGR